MRLVDDDRVVPTQLAIALQLLEQNAVRHQFHERAAAGVVVEPDLVAHGRADGRAHLVREAVRERARGESTRPECGR